MAGAKQHYIPQFLLRAFGKKPLRGKATQVVVFSKQRIFTTATEGVAAERYFYSAIDAERETLDDKITTYESLLATIHAKLCSAGESIDSAEVAEFLTHLAVRQAHFRYSFADGATRILTGLGESFRTEQGARRVFELDNPQPSKILRDAFIEKYQENKTALISRGISQDAFIQLAFQAMRSRFSEIHPHLAPLAAAFSSVGLKLEKSIQDGHNRALLKSLAPVVRVDALRNFTWEIEQRNSGDLLLPDCVAVAFSTKRGWQPFMFVGTDEIRAASLPLNRNLLLVGRATDGESIQINLDCTVLAACSREFFVAPEKSDYLVSLVSLIGKITEENMPSDKT